MTELGDTEEETSFAGSVHSLVESCNTCFSSQNNPLASSRATVSVPLTPVFLCMGRHRSVWPPGLLAAVAVIGPASYTFVWYRNEDQRRNLHEHSLLYP